MKKKVLAIIAAVMISSTMLLGCNVSVGKRDGIKISGKTQRYEVDETKSLSKEEIEGITLIDVNADVADVKIIPEDREDIEIKFFGSTKSNSEDNKHVSSISVKNKKVYIKTSKKKRVSISINQSSNYNLEVRIPETFDKKMNVTIDVGNAEIKGLNLEELIAESDVGNLSIEKTTGKIDIDSDVGNVSLKVDELKGDIKITTDTGNINLTVPEDGDFKVKAATDVGDINSFLPKGNSKSYVGDKREGSYGEGTYNIELDSDVGNIKINKN